MVNLRFPLLEFDLQHFLKKWRGKIKFREIALVIGKEFVDLVELRRTFTGPRLVNFVSVPIAARPVAGTVPEESAFSLPEMSRAVRLAHNIRATFVWAVVDAESDVTYYNIQRLTP